MELWEDESREGGVTISQLYQDPKRYTKDFQHMVLRDLTQRDEVLPPGITVRERSIQASVKVFAKLALTKGNLELQDYQQLKKQMKETVEEKPESFQPDLLIYLRASPSVAIERIQARDRQGESGIEPQFLSELNMLHDKWLWGADNVLTIDADKPFHEIATSITDLFDRLNVPKKSVDIDLRLKAGGSPQSDLFSSTQSSEGSESEEAGMDESSSSGSPSSINSIDFEPDFLDHLQRLVQKGTKAQNALRNLQYLKESDAFMPKSYTSSSSSSMSSENSLRREQKDPEYTPSEELTNEEGIAALPPLHPDPPKPLSIISRLDPCYICQAEYEQVMQWGLECSLCQQHWCQHCCEDVFTPSGACPTTVFKEYISYVLMAHTLGIEVAFHYVCLTCWAKKKHSSPAPAFITQLEDQRLLEMLELTRRCRNGVFALSKKGRAIYNSVHKRGKGASRRSYRRRRHRVRPQDRADHSPSHHRSPSRVRKSSNHSLPEAGYYDWQKGAEESATTLYSLSDTTPLATSSTASCSEQTQPPEETKQDGASQVAEQGASTAATPTSSAAATASTASTTGTTAATSTAASTPTTSATTMEAESAATWSRSTASTPTPTEYTQEDCQWPLMETGGAVQRIDSEEMLMILQENLLLEQIRLRQHIQQRREAKMKAEPAPNPLPKLKKEEVKSEL